MRLESVPKSTLIAEVASLEGLESALDVILSVSPGVYPPRRFYSYDIVEGAPFSGRVLFTGRINGKVQLPVPMYATSMAKEILKYNRDAGYIPKWEVRLAFIDREPAALVYCARK